MKKILFGLATVVGCFVGGQNAHADFLFVDIVSGADFLHVVDGGANDTDGIVNNAINVDPTALAAAFSTKITNQSSVAASSNLANAAADGLSRLSTSFTLVGKGISADFTITSGQADFTVPNDPKDVSTSGAFVFTKGNNGSAAGASFVGGIGQTNGAPFTNDTSISALATNNTTDFGGGSGTGFQFSNGNSSFAIQNVLTGHLIAQDNVVIQNSGTTTVQVPAGVPEPSTIVMLATFVGPLAFGAYRRHRRLAK